MGHRHAPIRFWLGPMSDRVLPIGDWVRPNAPPGWRDPPVMGRDPLSPRVGVSGSVGEPAAEPGAGFLDDLTRSPTRSRTRTTVVSTFSLR